MRATPSGGPWRGAEASLFSSFLIFLFCFSASAIFLPVKVSFLFFPLRNPIFFRARLRRAIFFIRLSGVGYGSCIKRISRRRRAKKKALVRCKNQIFTKKCARRRRAPTRAEGAGRRPRGAAEKQKRSPPEDLPLPLTVVHNQIPVLN